MKEPTMEEVLKLVTFDRDEDGELFVRSVAGSVWGSVGGTVEGTIGGREWEFVETPEEKAIRLIRERLYEEEIMALEEDE